MDLSQKIAALGRLKDYMLCKGRIEAAEAWKETKHIASVRNGWFTPEFIDLAVLGITEAFLDEQKLQTWVQAYPGFGTPEKVKKVGIVAAGNIPLVAFHDWLCAWLSGHDVRIKLSSKDDLLLPHLIGQLQQWYPETTFAQFQEMLKDCDAYIATGSNNSARYFEYYFSKYPHIIRRNRTSVALLTGSETQADLEALSDDVFQFFGLGCRNVTKIYVPKDYNFEPLLDVFEAKYGYLADHHKFKNNYDYNLALLLLNQTPYLTKGSILLTEQESLFSALSVLNYSYYTDIQETIASLKANPDLQCVVGAAAIPFGQAQKPSLTDYADGVDTAAFLAGL
jgi:hypothetical protein